MFTVIGAVGLAASARGVGSGLRTAAASSRAESSSLANGLKAAARSCNSFLGDTPVLMADGSTKRIDEVKAGDHVFATDPETGESGPREVDETFVKEGLKHLVEIEIDGHKIIATREHPFWLPDQKLWVEAKELRVGSVLQTSAAAQVRVDAIKRRIAVTRVHNMAVVGINTYYVLAGQTPILVHNTNGCGGIWTATKNETGVENAYGHYRKHGGDFPDVHNSLQYVQKATDWLNNPTATTLARVRGNGDIVRFDPSTNYFGVMTKDGVPRTFYVPQPSMHGYKTNLDYFNVQ